MASLKQTHTHLFYLLSQFSLFFPHKNVKEFSLRKKEESVCHEKHTRVQIVNVCSWLYCEK